MIEKINKLKIVKVCPHGLIVEQMNGESGFIHISECSHSYIANLNDLYVKNEYIYGKFLRENSVGAYFTLKSGHKINMSECRDLDVMETGGGYYILEHFLNKCREKEKND